jgi:hypothetical protein
MVLYYAPGGGLGHLTRANAFLYTMGYSEDSFIVLTSSNHAKLIFKQNNIVLISNELYNRPREIRYEIEMLIDKFQVEIFYVDSFPAGINGELIDLNLNGCKLRYIARLLNWNNYSGYTENFNLYIDTTYIIELLTDKHLMFILKYSEEQQSFKLQYPHKNNIELLNKILSGIERNIWLIVHSEGLDELNMLIKYAHDLAEITRTIPQYLIISQTGEEINSQSLMHIAYYQASDFFPFAEKIFTGCGYNVMAQTIPYISKHHFIPFKRRFDDQFQRARIRKQLIGNLKLQL